MRKRATILGMIGTFLLLVSQKEVYAKNYFLSVLGIETDDVQGIRNLAKKRNVKTRERIANNRLRRREDRVSDRADTAAAATVETIVLEDAPAPVKTSGKRTKEHAKNRQKDLHYEKKAKKHEEVSAIQSVAETGTAKKKRNKNTKEFALTGLTTPKEKEAERRYEKKADKRAAHKTEKGGATNRNGETAEQVAADRKYEKKYANHENHVAAKANANVIFPVDVTESTIALDSSEINRMGTNQDENAHKKKKEKLYNKKVNMKEEHAAAMAKREQTHKTKENAHERQAEKRYEKKVEHHQEETTARTFETSKTNAHEKQAEKHFEKKLANHQAEATTRTEETSPRHHKKKEHAMARQEAKNHEKRAELHKKQNVVVSVQSGGTSSNHKRGFNKKKQERIQREHAGEPRKKRGHRENKDTPADTISVRNGGPAIPEDTIPLIPLSFESDSAPPSLPVVTLYWGIFNNPEACPQHPCKLADAFDPSTEASILHGTGAIPDQDGNVLLVSTLYRTPEGVELGGPAPIDGLAAETSGALTSPGFYNTDAEVVVGIRSAPSAQSGTMAQILELTESINMQEDLEDFLQFASFQSGETGFGELVDFHTEQIVKDNGALVHLTRQNDVLQVYLETNVAS